MKPTGVIDCDAESVKAKARELIEGLETDREKAVALFYFVRDKIKYNPFSPGYLLEQHKASATLERGKGYCQHKAILLVALARAAGIPARLGFADIRDHRLPEKFRQIMGGSNLLIFHGYVGLYLDGKWVRVSPAFDLGTCRQGGFIPVDFDGINDAMDPHYTPDGELHVEYVQDRGYYEDFPWDELCEARLELAARIGKDLVELMTRWWGRKSAGRDA